MATWLPWTLVAIGIAFVGGAVVSLSGRLRPLRRALRRLSWRSEELARLQAKAESMLVQVEELTALSERGAAAASELGSASDDGRHPPVADSPLPRR